MIYNSNIIHDQQSQIKRGVGENNCTTARDCLRRETYAIPISPFSILRLAWGVKVQGFNSRSLRPAEILVASKEYQNTGIPTSKPS